MNPVEVLWCGAGIDSTPSWIYIIECSYDFIGLIYHADLDNVTFSVVKCSQGSCEPCLGGQPFILIHILA